MYAAATSLMDGGIVRSLTHAILRKIVHRVIKYFFLNDVHVHTLMKYTHTHTHTHRGRVTSYSRVNVDSVR